MSETKVEKRTTDEGVGGVRDPGDAGNASEAAKGTIAVTDAAETLAKEPGARPAPGAGGQVSQPAGEDAGELNFSDQSAGEPISGATELGKPYDPLPGEDAARRYIAYALIGIFGVTVLIIMALVYTTSIAVGDIKEFSVILGPLITLVSAATGFYYGTKSKGS